MNKKKKVVHIAQSAGGVEEYIKILLKNMKNDNIENIIIGSKEYEKNIDQMKNYSKIYYVDMVREIDFIKDIKAVLKIKKILKKEKPDIVYLHSSKGGALGRIALLFNRKIKIIYNAHGWYFNADIGKKKKLFRFIEKILAYKTNKIIAISESEYDSALQNKICNKQKLILIENGIETNEYKDVLNYRDIIREKYNIKKDDIVVGIVGRVSEQKDPITSIKAATKVIKNNRKIYFMFVGSGDLEDEVLSYAKNSEIDSNVIITGWVNDVKQFISAFDIAILPSKWEGFGLAILEYMICKKPIITTKIGGIANILNGENRAFFIEKEDADTLAQYIQNIIKNEKDTKKIINEMIEKNYVDCINRFSIERVVEQTEKLIQTL